MVQYGAHTYISITPIQKVQYLHNIHRIRSIINKKTYKIRSSLSYRTNKKNKIQYLTFKIKKITPS